MYEEYLKDGYTIHIISTVCVSHILSMNLLHEYLKSRKEVSLTNRHLHEQYSYKTAATNLTVQEHFTHDTATQCIEGR